MAGAQNSGELPFIDIDNRLRRKHHALTGGAEGAQTATILMYRIFTAEIL
jgi:hypothetical protein